MVLLGAAMVFARWLLLCCYGIAMVVAMVLAWWLLWGF